LTIPPGWVFPACIILLEVPAGISGGKKYLATSRSEYATIGWELPINHPFRGGQNAADGRAIIFKLLLHLADMEPPHSRAAGVAFSPKGISILADPLFFSPKPAHVPPLEPDFRPAALATRAFRRKTEAAGGVPLVIGLEREHGRTARYETRVFPEGHPLAAANNRHVERLVKFLLWQRGGWKVFVGGPASIGAHIRREYSPDGGRRFDFFFMGRDVYEKEFTVVACAPEEVPPARESGMPLGRHLEGCRIGFDLGASDRKVSAVIDGRPVFSEEVVWEPRKHADPDYHYREIRTALQSAAARMPRVDAVGGSSAGIFIDNRPMIASLFRAVPPERFGEVRNLFLRLREEMGVPLEVINDGDVTALAGAMSLEDNAVLGVALGSSEAAGYVDGSGNVMGWLNELAFAPVDYRADAALDEWSGDRGVGSQYFSQQCVFRLAPKAGIAIPADLTDADKLKFVQEKLELGDSGAVKIWESMGVFLGCGIAHYADFYPLRHVLILGRCTSGRGGSLLLEGALRVLRAEFPEHGSIHIQLPDEKSRRVGQSIAAASLPVLRREEEK
jgi:predicted NBD/HSP70 family sugar kinase